MRLVLRPSSAREQREAEHPESLFRWLRWGWLPLVGGCVAIALVVLVGWELLARITSSGPESVSFLVRAFVTAILMALWAGWYVLYARQRIQAVYERLRRDEIALVERGWRAEQSLGMGALSRILAHEIRNPLNGMALNGTLLKRKLAKLPGGEKLVPLVDLLAGETTRLANLVNDYLAYTQAKRVELSIEPVDVGALTRELVEAEGPALDAKGVVVEVVTWAGLPRARADGAKIRQVLHNLLRNATEAMPQGGHVLIEVKRDDTAIVLAVRDDGPGFESAESVLRPFYTTKSDGSGLGLAIVRDIVRAHGGEIDTRNVGPSGGAEIIIRLPLQEAQ